MADNIFIDCTECKAENVLNVDSGALETIRFGVLRFHCGRCGHALLNNKAEVRDASHPNSKRVQARSELDKAP